jgi:hypothetical protein
MDRRAGRHDPHPGHLPFRYCGNDTAHLAQAGVECCLYGPRGYPDDVEKHVRIDEMVIYSKAMALSGYQVVTRGN